MKLATFIAPDGAEHIGALLPGEQSLADFTASDAAPHVPAPPPFPIRIPV